MVERQCNLAALSKMSHPLVRSEASAGHLEQMYNLLDLGPGSTVPFLKDCVQPICQAEPAEVLSRRADRSNCLLILLPQDQPQAGLCICVDLGVLAPNI